MIWDQYHLCAIPANNTQPESDDLKLMSILHNNWPVLFKIVKVKKDKNSTRIQEIQETQQPNAMHDLGLDSGPGGKFL